MSGQVLSSGTNCKFKHLPLSPSPKFLELKTKNGKWTRCAVCSYPRHLMLILKRTSFDKREKANYYANWKKNLKST